MELFGFEIKKKSDKEEINLDNVSPENDKDGAYVLQTGAGRFMHGFDMAMVSKTEIDLITAYRRVALMPEVATAIDEIVNEMVVIEDDKDVVTIITDDLEDEYGESVIDAVKEEFSNVIRMLNFNHQAYNIVHDWYVDGRVVFQKVVDASNVNKGIKRIDQLDPKRIRKIKEVDDNVDNPTVVDEYYIYMPTLPDDKEEIGSSTLYMNGSMSLGLMDRTKAYKIKRDSITHTTSGLYDKSSNISYGHIHKSVKVANQLEMLRTALIIYRLARAPERRVFYVDTGNMNSKDSHAYMENIKREYRNKVEYDSVRGTTKDKNRVMSMQEDIFLQRRGGTNATEIDTLPGGQSLSEIDDIIFFKDELYLSLNVPQSRFKDDGGTLFGSTSEISREELKFNRFITRLRAQFNETFLDMLHTQLILKKIISDDEWSDIKERLRFKYNKDSFFAEKKEIEMIERRADAAEVMLPFVDKYVSHEFIRREIFGHTQEEIDDFDKAIAKEKTNSQFNSNEDG